MSAELSVEEALEYIESIRRKCEIAALVHKQGRDDLLPTVFEDLYEDAQTVVEGFCVVKESR